ncbi:hypothetical protein Pcinc_024920 [Petrolisthes cinctipes]|uniref:Uncharacterized protein n=1 Tax=Petrolisthes cinctipes TaxID=88211 RepID=A0AAE1KDR6_PETCI|nr:hypothetical protein Pcinc_024920 [Petrolisthes cinctipes]
MNTSSTTIFIHTVIHPSPHITFIPFVPHHTSSTTTFIHFVLHPSSSTTTFIHFVLHHAPPHIIHHPTLHPPTQHGLFSALPFHFAHRPPLLISDLHISFQLNEKPLQNSISRTQATDNEFLTSFTGYAIRENERKNR